jgi:hypothetical protein
VIKLREMAGYAWANRALVEHFFRQFGRLGAVLTRSLGVRRLALVEDVVQADTDLGGRGPGRL